MLDEVGHFLNIFFNFYFLNLGINERLASRVRSRVSKLLVWMSTPSGLLWECIEFVFLINCASKVSLG